MPLSSVNGNPRLDRGLIGQLFTRIAFTPSLKGRFIQLLTTDGIQHSFNKCIALYERGVSYIVNQLTRNYEELCKIQRIGEWRKRTVEVIEAETEKAAQLYRAIRDFDQRNGSVTLEQTAKYAENVSEYNRQAAYIDDLRDRLRIEDERSEAARANVIAEASLQENGMNARRMNEAVEEFSQALESEANSKSIELSIEKLLRGPQI